MELNGSIAGVSCVTGKTKLQGGNEMADEGSIKTALNWVRLEFKKDPEMTKSVDRTTLYMDQGFRCASTQSDRSVIVDMPRVKIAFHCQACNGSDACIGIEFSEAPSD